ncbi:hypothetical protein LTR95_002840 [Oleoguttula sp. CCFEE 5521]
MSGFTADELEDIKRQMMADLSNERSDHLSAPAADDKGRPRKINFAQEKADLQSADAFRAANRAGDVQMIVKWNSLNDENDPTAKADISGGQGHRHAVKGASEDPFAFGGGSRPSAFRATPARYAATTSSPHTGGINRTVPSARRDANFPTRLGLTAAATSNRPRAGSPRRHGTVRFTGTGRQAVRKPSAGAQQRAENPLLNRQLATVNKQLVGNIQPAVRSTVRDIRPSTDAVLPGGPQQPARTNPSPAVTQPSRAVAQSVDTSSASQPRQINSAVVSITQQASAPAPQPIVKEATTVSTISKPIMDTEDPKDRNVRVFLENVASGEISSVQLLAQAGPQLEEVVTLKLRAFEDAFCADDEYDYWFDKHEECMPLLTAVRRFVTERIIGFMQPGGNKEYERGFRIKYSTKKGFAEFIAAAEMAVEITTQPYIATGKTPYLLSRAIAKFDSMFPCRQDLLMHAIKAAGLEEVANMAQRVGATDQAVYAFETANSFNDPPPSLTTGTTSESARHLAYGPADVVPSVEGELQQDKAGTTTPVLAAAGLATTDVDDEPIDSPRAPSEPLPGTPRVESPLLAFTNDNTPAPLPAGAANPGTFTITLQQSCRLQHRTPPRPFAAPPGIEVNLTVSSIDHVHDLALRRLTTEPNNLIMEMERLGLWIRGFLMRPEGPTNEEPASDAPINEADGDEEL